MFREGVISIAALIFLGGAATACESQQGKVVFEDNFADDSGGWGVSGSSGVGKKEYSEIKNNTLIMRPNLNAKDDQVVYHSWLSAFSLNDGDYCVEFSLPPAPAADNNVAAGLMIWLKDNDNFYMVLVFTNKDIGLFKQLDGKWDNLFYLESNPSVKVEKDSVNSLRAVAKDGKLTFFVNGVQVKAMRAQPPEGDSHFGVYAQVRKPTDADTTVVFKNFKVTRGQ